MNRRARAALLTPTVALATSGLLTIACRGGGTVDGVDASYDGETTRQTATNGEACEKAVIAIEDTAADTAATGGPACTSDNECTIRLAGDYCACPNTSRPMSKSRAAAFDESLKGVTKRCTCQISPCDPPAPASVACREGRCVLAGADGT
jgi:hypothetical protein